MDGIHTHTDGVMYRVCVLSVHLLSACITAPAQAQGHDPEAELRTFAACVGRLTAIVEYEWNMSGTVSAETARRRDAATDIVAAIVPAEKSRDVLSWRNAARQAQSNLLSRATSSGDASDARWAMQQARHFETACTALLTL